MISLVEYYQTTYTFCPKDQSLMASWKALAYPSHLFMMVLTPLYLFGGYCIVYRTPVSMKPVKWSLLNWHCWCCIYDITVTSLMTPYFFFPLLAGFPVGFLSFVGVTTEVQLVISAAICYATIFSMTLVFENRFNILPINNYAIKRPSTRWIYYGIRILIFTANILIIGLNFPDQNEAVPRLLDELPCPVEEFFHNPIFVISSELPPWRHVAMALTISTLLGEAAQIVFFCSACMYFLFFSTKFTISPKTRHMQVRFFYMALVQIAIPIVFLLIPFVYFCFSILTGYYNQSLNNSFILFLPLHGLSSTAVMLAIHKPYRDFILSLSPWSSRKDKDKRSSSIFTHSSAVSQLNKSI